MAWVTGKAEELSIFVKECFTDFVSAAKDGECDDSAESWTAILTSMKVIPCRHVEGKVRRDFVHLP
jgi:hypothetical protein